MNSIKILVCLALLMMVTIHPSWASSESSESDESGGSNESSDSDESSESNESSESGESGEVDLCANITCGSNGTCDNNNGTCQCDPGFSGDMCQVAPRSCGTPIPLIVDRDEPNIFQLAADTTEECETACIMNTNCLTYTNIDGACRLFDRTFTMDELMNFGFNLQVTGACS